MNFFDFLEKTSLKEDDKKSLKFFFEYLSGKHSTLLSSKIVLLVGDAGIGKTYIAKKLISFLKIPVYYVGQENIHGENITHFKSIEELDTNISYEKDCLVFLDDMNYLADEEYGDVTIEHKRLMLSLLSKIKSSKKRIGFLGTINYLYFDPQLIDRVDIIINIEPPDKKAKIQYLEKKYNEFISKNLIKNIALKSIGYNFRDLDEAIRMAYRYGNGTFNKKVIGKALKNHMPSNFRFYEILNDIDINFNSIVGRENIKEKLFEIKTLFINKNKIKKFGLKRTNLLVFYGPPGTGKTYMAKAFAGELGFPLVNINATRLYREGPLMALDRLLDFASRFKESIILVDEADKLVGRSMYEEEGPLQGHINSIFDCFSEVSEAIVIFTLNKIENFGDAFLDRFTKIEFDYPSENERNIFLSNKIKKHSKIFESSIDLFTLSYMTSEYSFRDLEKIWNAIITKHIKTQKKITMTDFEEVIRPKRENKAMFG